MVASLEVNVNAMEASFVVAPFATVVYVIVMVGDTLSNVQLKLFEFQLLFPAASVNVFAGTLIVHSHCPLGVNVAVYTDPLPVKLLNVPLLTVTSPVVKLVVASLEVNVNAMVGLLAIALFATVVDVMVMLGGILSNVQLNADVAVLLFPAASVNLFARTLIVHAP